MKEDGRVAWSEKVDVSVVEVERLFRMMLEKKAVVDMLHWPFLVRVCGV